MLRNVIILLAMIIISWRLTYGTVPGPMRRWSAIIALFFLLIELIDGMREYGIPMPWDIFRRRRKR